MAARVYLVENVNYFISGFKLDVNIFDIYDREKIDNFFPLSVTALSKEILQAYEYR